MWTAVDNKVEILALFVGHSEVDTFLDEIVLSLWVAAGMKSVFRASGDSLHAMLSAGRKHGGGSVCYFTRLLWPQRIHLLPSSV